MVMKEAATGAKIGGAVAGPVGVGIGAVGGAVYGYFKGKKKAKAKEAAAKKALAEKQAYANFLKGLGQEYSSELGSQFEAGEKQFLGETGQALPELQAYAQDVRRGATEEQEAARRQMETDLARSGVRGGQAATLQARGIGKMGTDLSRAINEMALKEAETRRGYRAPYFGQKAMYPYKERAQAIGTGQTEAQRGYQKAAPVLFQTA